MTEQYNLISYHHNDSESKDQVELSLAYLSLSVVPKKVFKENKALRTLDLYNNQLSTLPRHIGRLSCLRVLNLHNNQLTFLPPQIGELTNLQEIYLQYNNLTELPKEIGKLKSLQHLHVYNNELQALPAEIGDLSNLRTLNLANNELTQLPPSIEKLSALNLLDLQNNRLAELPSGIGELRSLHTLNINFNQLTTLPAAILRLNVIHFTVTANNFEQATLETSCNRIPSLLDLCCRAVSKHLDTSRALPSELEGILPLEVEERLLTGRQTCSACKDIYFGNMGLRVFKHNLWGVEVVLKEQFCGRCCLSQFSAFPPAVSASPYDDASVLSLIGKERGHDHDLDRDFMICDSIALPSALSLPIFPTRCPYSLTSCEMPASKRAKRINHAKC